MPKDGLPFHPNERMLLPSPSSLTLLSFLPNKILPCLLSPYIGGFARLVKIFSGRNFESNKIVSFDFYITSRLIFNYLTNLKGCNHGHTLPGSELGKHANTILF